MLYSSVGLGGASSYLVVMSYFAISPNFSSTIALTLNIMVAGVAFTNYFKNGHFRFRLLLPFLVTSIPAALIGGLIKIELPLYQLGLNIVLLFVSFRLLFFVRPEGGDHQNFQKINYTLASIIGVVLGLVSGIIGIGGGIFLSPLIILTKWGNAKQAAATSAAFIVLNSLSGLIGRALGHSLEMGSFGIEMVLIGLIGGIIGSLVGARYLPNRTVQRLLGAVMLLLVMRYGISLINLPPNSVSFLIK